MENNNNKKINLSRAPYRGIVTEIAREQGVSQAAIWQGIYNFRNVRLLAILEEKINNRKSIVERVEREVSLN